MRQSLAVRPPDFLWQHGLNAFHDVEAMYEIVNVIEPVGFQDQAPRVRYYRVTAKGVGRSPNAEVILQSTYFR